MCVKHIQTKEAKKGNIYTKEARAFAFELSSESSFYSIETLIESRLKPYPLLYICVCDLVRNNGLIFLRFQLKKVYFDR